MDEIYNQKLSQPSPQQPSIFNNILGSCLSSIRNLLVKHRRLVLFFSFGALVILVTFFLYFQLLQKSEKVKVIATSITLTPTLEDTLGVDPKSAFFLASKNPLNLQAIKSSLKVEPATSYKIQEITDRKFKITFTKPLENNKIYRFQLAARSDETTRNSTIDKDLSWAFQIKSLFRVVQTLPRDKATSVPLNSGIEITFSHDNYKDIAPYFEITPKVKGRFERHKRTVAFIPKGLKASTLYTIKVKKSLGLVGSEETLEEDFIFQFETAPKPSSRATYRIGFAREISEFPRTEKPVFSLYLSDSNKTPTLRVDVFKFQEIDQFINSLKEKDKIPIWARYSRQLYLQDTLRLQKVLSFEASVQKLQYSGYFIFPQTLPDGYYLVEARFDNRKLQTWLQITDIASYLSTSKTKTLAWTNDLESKMPVANAKLQLVDSYNIQATNGEGVAFFNTPEELLKTDTRRYFKVTTPQGKTSVIPVAQTFQYYGYYGGHYDRPGDISDQYWAYLYLDRQIYLPTDSVQYWGIVRNRDNPQEVRKLKLNLTRSDYRDYNYQPIVILEQDIYLSEMGTFIGEIPLKNFQTGYYSVEIKKGEDTIVRNGFSVTTYTKPAYRVDIEPTKKAIFAGEAVDFKGKTSFFEGTAVPKVKLKYTGAIKGEITSDEKGEFTITYQPQYRAKDLRYTGPHPFSSYINIAPVLSEEGEIEGRASVLVSGSRITFKTKTEVSQNLGTVRLTANTITFDRLNNGTAKNSSDYIGRPIANQLINGKLYENRWEKKEVGEYYDFINKVTRKRYEYTSVKNFLNDVSFTTDDNGQAIYQFPLAEDKYYQLDLETADGEGHKVKETVYLYGRQGSYPQKPNYYHLESNKKDSNSYSVGEDVALTLKKGEEVLPTGGDNRYLFRLAQRGIKDYKTQDEPILSFNFVDSYIPNIVAKAVYFNGKTFFESDSLSLIFKKEDKKLAIEINTDKPSYRPKDTVGLDVVVKDKNGLGQNSEVNISLVDEAIFKLRGQEVDTLGDLYHSISSGVIQSYASHQYPIEVTQPEMGGCFLAGTKILLPNNKEKNIEDVEVEDIIFTRESERSSRLVKARVIKTFKHLVGEYLLINEILRVTPEHNLFVNGRWMVAADLRLGDYLLDDTNHWVEITSIEQRKGKFEVYNLEVEKYQTFFADKFYVHNQKGRELFADRAFFGIVKTDNTGKGKLSFKLPDNLTSWRITYQAISSTLSAGSGTKLLPVKLPFFVDMVLNSEYLEGDKPIIKLRSFGESLKAGQEVEFIIKIPSLGLKEGKKLSAKAFEVVSFKLPPLKEGEHKITITGKSGDLEDTVTRPIKVYKTRLTRGEAEYYVLSENTKIKGSNDSLTTLVFSNQNRGKFYPILSKLSYTYGDRVDQKIARIRARQLLVKFFNEEGQPQEEFKPGNYQTPKGGISLFPYSDADLALSAKVTSIAGDLFDKIALRQYFYKILDDPREGRQRTAIALYGLASLGEPILVPVNSLLKRGDLTPKELLYLGLASAELGNKEKGGEILKLVLEEFGEEFKPYLRIKVGRDQGDILEATVLAADLAVLINAEQKDKLFQYVLNNATKDILIYLEDLIYVVNTLPNISGQPVQFTYVLGGRKISKTLEKEQVFKLQVTPEELSQIKFEDLKGKVGLTSFFIVPFDNSRVRKDENISVSREYSVEGRRTTEFGEADLVKTTVNYKLGSRALDGCYQVSDFLPSGLKVVTRPYSRGIRDQNIWYPYDITNQKVSFCVSKTTYRPIVYYARVISKGEYKAESAIIQSLKSVDSFNISNPGLVKIK